MKRGELYGHSRKPGADPKKARAYVVVSCQALIDSRFSTVICAPIYSARHGLATQVNVGSEEGLKHESSIHCDELVSIPKSALPCRFPFC
ncbi:MAG: type II toxin-antitoxin system PemK/MazF family toxin [Acidobacteriota bacterium]